MTQDAAWPKSLTAVIAGQVQRIRSERGMSAQQLADATAALGHAVPRSVIANLESGRRDTVSIGELLVLARALEVPPLLLIFPIGSEETVEILPGVHAPTWPAARWFTGEDGFPTPGPDDAWAVIGDDRYTWINAVTNDFRGQEVAIDGWRRARSSGDSREEAAWERSLRLIRARIRDRGLDPGELADDVAHLDDHGGPDGQR